MFKLYDCPDSTKFVSSIRLGLTKQKLKGIYIIQIYLKWWMKGNHNYRDLDEQDGVSPSTLRQWLIRYNSTKSFNAEDNRIDEENRVIELEKRVKQLEMENDILKYGGGL